MHAPGSLDQLTSQAHSLAPDTPPKPPTQFQSNSAYGLDVCTNTYDYTRPLPLLAGSLQVCNTVVPRSVTWVDLPSARGHSRRHHTCVFVSNVTPVILDQGKARPVGENNGRRFRGQCTQRERSLDLSPTTKQAVSLSTGPDGPVCLCGDNAVGNWIWMGSFQDWQLVHAFHCV